MTGSRPFNDLVRARYVVYNNYSDLMQNKLAVY